MTSGDEGKLFAGLPEHPAPERTYQDKPRLRMAERRQVELRAICLDDLVPTDHRVAGQGFTFLISAHASNEEIFLVERLASAIAVSWTVSEKPQPARTKFKVP